MMGRNPARSSSSPPTSSKVDSLLEAAKEGWDTTFRYAFLLLVKRGTVGAIILTSIELMRAVVGHWLHLLAVCDSVEDGRQEQYKVVRR